MATSSDAVRAQLAVVTERAAADLAAEVAGVSLEQQVRTALATMPLLVPAYYDAAGTLAVDWYGEIRDESSPTATYFPAIIGDPATDWIDREVERLAATLDADLLDLEAQTSRLLDEAVLLAEKEIARGFRDSILGNTRQDEEAIGWSRVARPGACKFCVMLAGKGSVYRSESTAIFAAHTSCHCAARPAFRNGEHGPEATVEQYLASQSHRTPAQQAALRKYLNTNFPDAPG